MARNSPASLEHASHGQSERNTCRLNDGDSLAHAWFEFIDLINIELHMTEMTRHVDAVVVFLHLELFVLRRQASVDARKLYQWLYC